jgi:hypothetical protein
LGLLSAGRTIHCGGGSEFYGGPGNQPGRQVVKICCCAPAVAGTFDLWRCGGVMGFKWKKVVMGCGMGRGK